MSMHTFESMRKRNRTSKNREKNEKENSFDNKKTQINVEPIFSSGMGITNSSVMRDSTDDQCDLISR